MFCIVEYIRNNNKILFGVIDSTDNVVEYYSPDELLKIARDNNLDIIGMSKDKRHIIQPYKLSWRFDFDNTLNSVLTINDDSCDLSDASVVEMLKVEFSYLIDLRHFENFLRVNWDSNFIPFKKLNANYIDFVNIGFKCGNNKYDFVQYWRTDLDEFRFDYAYKGCPLSNLGRFQFDDSNLPCRTRTLENGIVVWDFRKDSEYNAQHYIKY